MSSSSEYIGPSSGGPACSYNTLCAYNSGWNMGPSPHNAKPVQGHYVVPAYAAPGYNTLVKCPGSCSGYCGIGKAYGKNADKCNQAYMTTLCSGCKYSNL